MLKGFLKSERGGVFVILCIAMVPLMLIVGLAVDSAMAYNQQRKIQEAVESAARSAANVTGTDAAITQVAQAMFTAQANGMTGVTGPTITISDSAGTITVSASVLVNTIFMNVGGVSSGTYTATATKTLSPSTFMEIAIMVEASQYAINSGWLANAANALKTFIATLPTQTLVSITPTNTSVIFDPTSTNQGSFFNYVSSKTNDESVTPAFFPLSPNYAWNATNFALVNNIFYSYTFPTMTSYYPTPGTCPVGTMNACSTFYPGLCSGKTSCRSNYSYYLYPMVTMLPLTANRTTINTYLTNLGATTTAANGLFASLISWAWRSIDPNWNGFFLTNSDPAGTTRSSGTYPQAYNVRQKSIIVMVEGDSFWDDVQSPAMAQYYTSPCGASSTTWKNACKTGYPCFNQMQYVMTAYGALPLTSNASANNDNTCQNYNYVTVDQGLGLNRSSTSYLDTLDSGYGYESLVETALNAKMDRICSNINSVGVDIYIIYQLSSATLAGTACSKSSGNVYNISNTQAGMTTALTSIYTQIMAKQAPF